MKNKRTKLSVILFLGLGLTGLQAQESVNSAGGNTSDNGGSVSYSIGQIVYQTHSGTKYSEAQGVQQAYEIYVVTEIEDTKDINLSVKAYPNPVVNNLTLSVNEYDVTELSYDLYNITGKLIKRENIISQQTNISMSELSPAIYFVKVCKNNNAIKTFKIIKK